MQVINLAPRQLLSDLYFPSRALLLIWNTLIQTASPSARNQTIFKFSIFIIELPFYSGIYLIAFSDVFIMFAEMNIVF